MRNGDLAGRTGHGAERVAKMGAGLWRCVPSALSLLLLFPAAAQAAYAIPGQFSVGADGAANYSIPIQVSPGTAGMEPKLTLSYNSNGNNGPLGMGWGMGGLSQISRCPQNKAQDGKIQGVNFENYQLSGTDNDRYCLDGQRLVAIQGAYGGDGTEYRTEQESFSRIKSYGVAGDGPAWFEVRTKSGQIIEYGNTADSRIEAQGKPSVFTWGVNKIRDTKGNYLTVTYTENNANGETQVSRIDYTGNAATGLVPYASVRFTYEARLDVVPHYLAGSVFKTTQRLSKIQSYFGEGLVREYRLTYEQGASTQRSRIKTLVECDAAGLCLPPTSFGWLNRANILRDEGAVATNLYGSWTDKATRTWVMDVNGDGRSDVVLGPEGTGNWYVMRSTGTGFVNEGAWITGAYSNWTTSTTRIRPMDVNGDGMDDILIGPDASGNWYVLRSTGTGFVNAGVWASGMYGSWSDKASRTWAMDVNGDGLKDLVLGPEGTGNWYVMRSTGTGFVNDGAWIAGVYGNWTTSTDRIRPMDVNDDGLEDILIGPDASGNWFVLRSTGTGFVNAGAWASGMYGSWSNKAERIWVMDVNGDGLKDRVLGPEGTGNWYVLRSTGAGFVNDGAWITGAYGNWTTYTTRIRPMDVNGDGMEDILIGPEGTGNWYVLRSTGTGFVNDGAWISGVYSNWTTATARIRAMDMHGDGLAGILIGPDSAGSWFYLDTDPPADVLSSISNGLGYATTISYKAATDGSVYSKDSGATASSYPVMDIQYAQYLVSSVSTSDGVGGTAISSYTYGGAKVNLTGRGSLGFRWMKSRDEAGDVEVTTTYRQDYPYIGLPITVEKKRISNGLVLGRTQHTYASKPLPYTQPVGGSPVFPYVAQSVEQNTDLSGTAYPNVTTSNSYGDDYGNVTQVSVSSSDGHSKTTVNSYSNDSTNWFLGRLLRSTVTSTSP